MYKGKFSIVLLCLKHVVSCILTISMLQDDTDYRGRWKNSRRQHETYADTDIGWVDAKVASSLCKGGPIAYVIDPLSGVTDQWVLDHVVPNLSKKVPVEVAKVLGGAVLFHAFDSSTKAAFPSHRKEHIRDAYFDLGARNQLEVGVNPVKRKPLVVTGHDSEVVMDFMDVDDTEQDARRSLALRQEEVRMLSSQVLHLRRELMDARAEAECQLAVLKRQMGCMSNNISRISSLRHATVRRDAALTTRGTSVAAPIADNNLVVGLVGGANGMVDCAMDVSDVVPVVLEARLTKCPKTLYDLWKEYEFGFRGCKPAKDWTAAEWGRDKFKYYQRNVVWKMISELIRGGGGSAGGGRCKIYKGEGLGGPGR